MYFQFFESVVENWQPAKPTKAYESWDGLSSTNYKPLQPPIRQGDTNPNPMQLTCEFRSWQGCITVLSLYRAIQVSSATYFLSRRWSLKHKKHNIFCTIVITCRNGTPQQFSWICVFTLVYTAWGIFYARVSFITGNHDIKDIGGENI